MLASIPKNCCIFSDPDCGDAKDMRLLPATAALMRAVAPEQWRLRLALALLSERVRPRSAFRAFLRNLPTEYKSLPMFFGAFDFSEIQDAAIMQRQRDRCRFLQQFATHVLAPMRSTAQVLVYIHAFLILVLARFYRPPHLSPPTTDPPDSRTSTMRGPIDKMRSKY